MTARWAIQVNRGTSPDDPDWKVEGRYPAEQEEGALEHCDRLRIAGLEAEVWECGDKPSTPWKLHYPAAEVGVARAESNVA